VSTEKYDFERYLNVRLFHGPSFSPDGKFLSFLTNVTGVDEVWSVPVEMQAQHPSWPSQLTFRGERFVSATFSPKEDILLVSGDVGGNERKQLYTLSVDGSLFTPLTKRPEVMHLFGGWSPDGTRITYSSNERDQRYFDVYDHHIASGEVKRLFRQDGSNHALKYSPDGQQVLVSHYESNVRNQLLLVDVVTGNVEALTAETNALPSLYSTAEWSVAGDGLYVLSNYGRQFLSLAYLDLITKEMTYLIDTSWDVTLLAMTPDGKRMAFVTNEDGYSRLEIFEVPESWDQRRSLAALVLPKGVVEEITWSQDGTRLAITFNCADDSPSIWVWDVETGSFWRATPSSLGGIPRSSFISPSLVRYPTFDGREIPAFLYLPHEKVEQLPIVVYVHGGPEGQSLPIFNPVIQYFVAHGYGVLAPNVRGSSGYGYEYQSLDDVRLRMDSVADLQYAAFWLKESGIADPERIAIMGGSYGGFMVLSAVTTYPDLWAAGVDIVGIANFVTFLENTGPWRRKIRESEYGSLENDREFLEQISPIHSVDRIRAPMCIIHGANDPRVPVGEAEQIVTALHAHYIPVKYMRFEDEGHGLFKRANRLIAYPAIALFLEEHLGDNV
jgi:dipeptidyl aminopeptidase/acylaminoacyl peptidase